MNFETLEKANKLFDNYIFHVHNQGEIETFIGLINKRKLDEDEYRKFYNSSDLQLDNLHPIKMFGGHIFVDKEKYIAFLKECMVYHELKAEYYKSELEKL